MSLGPCHWVDVTGSAGWKGKFSSLVPSNDFSERAITCLSTDLCVRYVSIAGCPASIILRKARH